MVSVELLPSYSAASLAERSLQPFHLPLRQYYQKRYWIGSCLGPEPEWRTHIARGKGVARKVALGIDMEGCSGTVDNLGFKYIAPLSEEELAAC